MEDDDIKLGANSTELQFVERAMEKRGRTFRHGWPDFLVELPDKTIGVEVKRDSDAISPRQARMFEALERVGIRIYVWTPHTADRLMPWRSYDPRIHKRKRVPSIASLKRRMRA